MMRAEKDIESQRGRHLSNIADVIAIGDINVDIITSPISTMPERETSFTVDAMGLYTGGNAANFAAAAASLGMQTTFIGALGKDPIGEWIREAMKKCGVRLATKSIPKVTSGITFAISYVDGTRQFIATHGTNLEFGYEDVDLSLLESARHVHRAGFWYCPKLMGEPTRRLLKYTREKGVQTSLDIGWDSQGWTEHRVSLAHQALEEADILFVNERELQQLTRREEVDDAMSKLLQMGVSIIALHMGKKGSMVVNNKESLMVPAFQVKPLNPTGSGDVYNAAFVHGLLQGWTLRSTAEFANAAAAVHILRTTPTFPELHKVEEFMTRYGARG